MLSRCTISLTVLAGLDTKPILTPIQQFGKEYHRTLSALPQQPPVCSAPSKRLMVSWWDRGISIWRISKSLHAHDMFEGDDESRGGRRTKLISKIELQVQRPTIHSFGQLRKLIWRYRMKNLCLVWTFPPMGIC